jgi:hypothetical protein
MERRSSVDLGVLSTDVYDPFTGAPTSPGGSFLTSHPMMGCSQARAFLMRSSPFTMPIAAVVERM